MKKKLTSALLAFSLLTLTAVGQRGYYDAPYTRYEADQGSLSNANATSRSFDQADLQSEASEQVCVDLSGSNAAVEWTVTSSGNGLVVRYSVPDGQTGQIEVFADGQSLGTIDLDAYYSWEYLSTNGNPNNSNVSNDMPKMRFDERRLYLPEIVQTGATLRIERRSGDVHLDFAELEMIPVAIEAESGDIVYTGDGSDLQSLIDNHGGRTIYLPAGVYNVNRELYFGVDDTQLKGAGAWHTQIHFTNNSGGKGGLRANAYGISYSGLYLTTVRNSRSNSYKAINGVYNYASVITDVWAEHFEVGAWIAQYNQGGPAYADGFTMSYCRFRNNYADGCNLAKGTRNSTVEHCSFRNNGDDDMAMWSANGQECRNNTYRYNTSENGWRSSGVSIYGGYNNKAHHIIVRDHVEAGIKVNNFFPGVGFNSSGMHEFNEITLERCGTFNSVHLDRYGAIEISLRETAGDQIRNVTFSNIDITDSKCDAIHVNKEWGDGFYNLNFQNINIDGTGLEYPNNNQDGSSAMRGFGILFDGYPAGYGTYCNITYQNIGGNANEDVRDNEQGSFDFISDQTCEERSITLTSPDNNATTEGCEPEFTISADASSAGAPIEYVRFYSGDDVIGEDASEPFTMTWTEMSAGGHYLWAEVVTADGSTQSQSVYVYVEKSILGTLTAPLIDGEVDAMWDDIRAEPLRTELFGGNGISGDDDLSAWFKITMDLSYLYLLIDVTDEKLVRDNTTQQTWNDDKVELYIDYGNDKDTDYGSNDHSYGFVYDNPTFYVGPGVNTGAEFAQVERTGGYVTEIRIPWTTLGGVPKDGDEIGLDVMVGDDDNGDDRDSKISWNDDGDNAWNNPSVFGTATLMPGLNHACQAIVHSSVEQLSAKDLINLWPNPATNLLHIDSESKLETLTLFDITGKELLTSASMRSGKLDLTNFQPGMYHLVLINENGIKQTKKIIKK